MSTVEISPADAADRSADSRAGLTGLLGRFSLFVVAVGVIWRLSRYLLRFPVWGDEVYLLVNYPGKSYLDLTGPIENCQVAPILFHWAELTAIRFLGMSELAVRFFPLLASLASLALFAWLARMTLPAVPRRIALAILAVSIWPATMGSLVKPYTFDLFFSIGLLCFAVAWHRRPERLWPLAALTGFAAIAMLGSYPAAFVGGSASVALLPMVWRQRRASVWAWFVLYNVVLIGVFAGHYLTVGRAQLSSPAGDTTTAVGMHLYWKAGFPPTNPLAFLWWFLLANTGQIAAYPFGAVSGGSIVTVAIALVGAARLWRTNRFLLGLLAGVFVLNLLAAALHKYPYGASCRLAQHLAPGFCLLAGLGLWVLLANRPRALVWVFAVLTLIGAIGIARDFVRPGRWDDEDSRSSVRIVAEMEAASGDGPIEVRGEPKDFNPYLRWHLVRRGDRVRWLPKD